MTKAKQTSLPIMRGIDPALFGCIMFYSQDCYTAFDMMSFEDAKAAADTCSEASQHAPLWMRDKKGEFPKVQVPKFGERSGPWAIACMTAFLVWTQRHLANNPSPDSVLLKAASDGYDMWKALRNAPKRTVG